MVELDPGWLLCAGPATRQNQASRTRAAMIEAPVVLVWVFARTSGLLDLR